MASIIFDQESRCFSVVDETKEFTHLVDKKGNPVTDEKDAYGIMGASGKITKLSKLEDAKYKGTKKYEKVRANFGGEAPVEYKAPTAKQSAAYKKDAKASAKKYGLNPKNFQKESKAEKERLENSGYLDRTKKVLLHNKSQRDAKEASRVAALKTLKTGRVVGQGTEAALVGGAAAGITYKLAKKAALKKGLVPGTPEYKAYIAKRTAAVGVGTAGLTALARNKTWKNAQRKVAANQGLLK